MTNQTQTTPAPAAAAKVSTLQGVLAAVLAAIVSQNDINVVESGIEKITGEGAPKNTSRVRLVISGAGVSTPTRRYFLRENSAFATLMEDMGIHTYAPKKDRNSDNYVLYFGLNDSIDYSPPAAEKAAKVLLSVEERSARRQAGKAKARLARASAAAEAAESVSA